MLKAKLFNKGNSITLTGAPNTEFTDLSKHWLNKFDTFLKEKSLPFKAVGVINYASISPYSGVFGNALPYIPLSVSEVVASCVNQTCHANSDVRIRSFL